MRLNANSADHDGEILELINAGDATSTGTGLSISMPNITTGAATGINVTMAGATTTAKGISVTMDALTTGDMLYLDNGGNTMTGDGKFINCNDDNVSKFSVAADGLTTIAGSASGTDALVITAGDILITSGHLDMTVGDLTLVDGSASITDADNATSLTVVNNTITTADALVDISSNSLTTGAMMRLNANSADHDGEILELINAGDATSTGTGLSISMPNITTGAATGINVTMAGATTTAKGISVTMDALTTGDMLYLDNGGNTMTGDGKFINCNDDNVSKFSVAADGLTTIAGSASGTDALVITAGDILITSGHLDMTAGAITATNNAAAAVCTLNGGANTDNNAVLALVNSEDSTDADVAVSFTAHNKVFAFGYDGENDVFGLAASANLGTNIMSVTPAGALTTAAGITATSISTSVKNFSNDANGDLEVVDSNKIILVTNAMGANRTITLPAVADAAGVHYLIKLAVDLTGTLNISSDAAGELVIGGVQFVNTDTDIATTAQLVQSLAGGADEKIELKIATKAGTWIDLTCSGTHWYITGTVFANTAPTFEDA